MRMRLVARFLVVVPVLAGFALWSQQPAAKQAPATPQLAHYHHAHFNVVDPAKSIEFYTTRFNGEKAKLGSTDAVWAANSWLLFDKVPKQAPYEITSGLYHIGWGAQDIKGTYQRLVDSGTKFELPLSDLNDLLDNGNPGRSYYAYVEGPDKEHIELNQAGHNNFQHVHLLSDDPVGASQWYIKEFGLPSRGPAPSREPRMNKFGVQVGPAVFLNADGVLFAWFPTGAAKGIYPKVWATRTSLEPSKGHVLDHIAFSVDNLNESLERLQKDGVKILEGPKMRENGALRSAFIEGPDSVLIEIVEGRAVKP